MAKKAKKKFAVSKAVRTVKKAAASTARSTRKVAKKNDAGENRQEEIFPALTTEARVAPARKSR